MNNQDQKKTWVVFTKLVLWSTLAVILILVALAVILL